jgi:hypothetical protein
MNLLIHADPGARSGLLAAWLTDTLTQVSFDVGDELKPKFFKIHKLNDVNDIKLFDGIKIRIRPSLAHIDLHTVLFLRKNVYTMIPRFTRNEYSIDTFAKLTRFVNEIFQWDSELDYEVYDYVINFEDTFDTEYLKDLYFKITGKPASQQAIDTLEKTNAKNQISLDKNHACSIMKLVLTQERNLNLKEKDRHWSIVEIYKNTLPDQLYDTVSRSIVPSNYNIPCAK